MATSVKSRFRKQVRGFVFVWTGLTVVLALGTFIAIYLAYGSITPTPGSRLGNLAIPETETSVAQVSTATEAVAPTATTATVTEAAPTTDTSTESTVEDANGAEVAALSVNNAAPTATPLPSESDVFELGVQVQVSYDNMGQWIDTASQPHQLGVGWVKQQIRWEAFEPADNEFDWMQTDIYIPAAAERGIKVLVSIVTAPDWAREPGLTPEQLEAVGPPADPNQFAEFITALLERYPNQIHAVEVWNEMNLDREWTSTEGLSAENYVNLLRVAYQAVKNVDPGVIVITGALAPTGLSDGVQAYDDFVYIDQLIAAGALNYSDCIGAHTNGFNLSPEYRWDDGMTDSTAQFRGPFDNPHHSWSFLSTIETYAQKVELAGGDQQICITEFGWPSAQGLEGVRPGFEFALDNTLREQAEFTVEAIRYMIASGYVRLGIVWNLNYGAQAGWDINNDNVPYSLIGPGFHFRCAFDAIRDFNALYESDPANLDTFEFDYEGRCV